jgi:thioredoxin-like negative regulator of GroEL
LAKARLARGAEEEALEAVEGHEADFAAAGIVARVRLAKVGIGSDGFAALDRGEREAALDALLEELEQTQGDNWSAAGLSAADLRDLLRRAIVGILSEIDPADPTARAYRRKLAAALG